MAMLLRGIINYHVVTRLLTKILAKVAFFNRLLDL